MDLRDATIGQLLSETLSRSDLDGTIRLAIQDSLLDYLGNNGFSLDHPAVVKFCFELMEEA